MTDMSDGVTEGQGNRGVVDEGVEGWRQRCSSLNPQPNFHLTLARCLVCSIVNIGVSLTLCEFDPL